jgi:hypothetical protein
LAVYLAGQWAEKSAVEMVEMSVVLKVAKLVGGMVAMSVDEMAVMLDG